MGDHARDRHDQDLGGGFGKRTGNPWSFFALAYATSWLFWVPAALWAPPEPAAVTLILHYLGGLALPAVAVSLVYLRLERAGRRDFWRRIVDVRRIEGSWYAVVFGIVPLLIGVAALLDLLLGGRGVWLESRFAAAPLSVLPFSLFTLLFGPLPEEIAWRGYALDGLQARHSALISSLVLGTAWTLWHLPLFWIEGSYQAGLLGSAALWLFLLDKIPQSVVMTAIYNSNRRSTLSAVLLHFMINLMGELLALTLRAEAFYVAGWWIAAAAVTLLWGSRSLARRAPGTADRAATLKAA